MDDCRENRAAASVMRQRETSSVMVFASSAGGTHGVGVFRSSANTVSGFRFFMRPRHDLLENRVIAGGSHTLPASTAVSMSAASLGQSATAKS